MDFEFFDDLEKSFGSYSEEYNFTRGSLSTFNTKLNNQKEALKDILEDKKYLEALSTITEKFIVSCNEETVNELQELVNRGLSINFPDSGLALKIDYNTRGKYQTVVFSILKNGIELPIKNSQSGGVVDIISFLLRVISIRKKSLRRIMFLDEAMNNVSDNGDYTKNTSYLIREICDKQGFSILLTTHKEILSSHAKTIFKCSRGDDGFLKMELQVKDYIPIF